MFTQEWCAFCWSVRKVLAEYGIDYRPVDLDSVAYLDDNRGGKICGCTDLFDGCKDGSLLQQLDSLQIPRNESVQADPYSFLPGWLHPR